MSTVPLNGERKTVPLFQANGYEHEAQADVTIVAPVDVRDLVVGHFQATSVPFTIHWHYVGDSQSAADHSNEGIVALPALNEVQTAFIQKVAQSKPLLSVVAVLTDAQGHLTHMAIRAGAALVLNTLLDSRQSSIALWTLAQLRCRRAAHFAVAHRHITAPDPAPPPVPPAPLAFRQRQTWPSPLDPDARQLLQLLCTPQTTAEIAGKLHCSERSMYRRLRKLYRDLGVAGRRELRMLIARSRPVGEG